MWLRHVFDSGAEVDEPVGGFDDVEVVFDHHDRIP
jgi:hypothetical protein